MDDIVKQALAKWPNVPDCYGWLALDDRGDWYMRDDRIQAQGQFPHPKGSRLQHEKLIDFIGRNYEADEHGRWYFQNGPQKVFVELQSTPWIFRLQALGQQWVVTSHTGVTTTPLSGIVDENGRLYLSTPLGLGLVHSMDMLAAADAIGANYFKTEYAMSGQLPGRFGYQRHPGRPTS